VVAIKLLMNDLRVDQFKYLGAYHRLLEAMEVMFKFGVARVWMGKVVQ
jgi:hypothetical protein